MDRQVVRAFNYGSNNRENGQQQFNNNTMSTNHNHLTSNVIIIVINTLILLEKKKRIEIKKVKRKKTLKITLFYFPLSNSQTQFSRNASESPAVNDCSSVHVTTIQRENCLTITSI